MTLAALIRKSESVRFATATPATVATLGGDKARTVATVATVSVANAPEAKTTTASRWWLIHYPDCNPVEVASFPPATHADILERHPEAIAAEPINQAAPEPAWSCSTCTHVTGRGGCGEPVAAGLEHLIVRAGAFWEYSPEDFDLIREVARRDPDGLRLALENDVAFNRGETEVRDDAQQSVGECWSTKEPAGRRHGQEEGRTEQDDARGARGHRADCATLC